MSQRDAAAPAELSTPRLTLRPPRPDDAATLFALMNDWQVASMVAEAPWPLTHADVEASLAGKAQWDGGRDRQNFVVWLDDVAIGIAGVKAPGSGDPPRKMPRLGYWLGPAHWGRGYGQEAVAVVTGYAFSRFPGERIGAGVFHDNAASRRLLEKLGFEEAGRYHTPCLARGAPVLTIDMHLTRAKFAGARR